jgi:undecaprenyl-diphosphatase
MNNNLPPPSSSNPIDNPPHRSIVSPRFLTVWFLILCLATLACLAAAHWPRFPGDLPLARALQSLVGESLGWSSAITATAQVPGRWILGLLTALVAAWIAGWRGAIAAVVAMALLWTMDPWIKPMIGRPRPSPELVRVIGSAQGVSFPSTFGLIYAATFGLLLALTLPARSIPHRAVATMALVALCLGIAARVAPGAHWPSDVLGAYQVGSVIILPLAVWCRRPHG